MTPPGRRRLSLDEARWSVIAAMAFADERRAYYGELVADTERELFACAWQRAEEERACRQAGVQWALLLGLPPAMGPIVAVMLYSVTLEHRERAAGLIARGVARSAREHAA